MRWIKVMCSGVQMPPMNAIIGRWVRTCRRELLDRTLIWIQRHATHVLRQFEIFYNEHRPTSASPTARTVAEPIKHEVAPWGVSSRRLGFARTRVPPGAARARLLPRFYLAPPKSGSTGTVELDPRVAQYLAEHIRRVPPVEYELPDITTGDLVRRPAAMPPRLALAATHAPRPPSRCHDVSSVTDVAISSCQP